MQAYALFKKNLELTLLSSPSANASCLFAKLSIMLILLPQYFEQLIRKKACRQGPMVFLKKIGSAYLFSVGI